MTGAHTRRQPSGDRRQATGDLADDGVFGRRDDRFRVFALDSSLDLPPGASPAQLSAAISGHVIAQGQLQATYAG